MVGFNDKSIAVLGDSISNGYYDETGRGWVVRLCEKLNADKAYGYYIRNHAVSGDTIMDVKYRLFNLIEKGQDITFFAVGVNDTQIYGHRDNDPYFSMEARHKTWDRILKFSEANCQNIFVFGLLPVNEDKIPARATDWGTPQFYRNDVIRTYNDAIKTWCNEYSIPFLDNFQRFWEAGYKDLLADDVHPNAKGHELLAEWACEFLKDKI